MPSSWNSSNDSAPCRIEWRPSRLLAGALAMLGALGAVSAIASEAPVALVALLAPASLATGAWLAGRELARPPMQLVWTPGRGLAIDGVRVANPHVSWRGPLAFLAWSDHEGRRHRVSWWPDTLGSLERRELRLAAIASPTSLDALSMAP